MSQEKIGIAADHAGFELKEHVKEHLAQQGFEVVDFGTHSTSSMDYPDIVHPLCKALGEKKFERAVLICGSAQGVAITANKYPFVRAAICWVKEIAEATRQHNNSNIICLPARFISEAVAIDCLDTFLKTDFEGGRHQNRIDKITAC